MRLRLSVLARSSSVFLILICVIGVSSRYYEYTQEEIDTAARKMRTRGDYFLKHRDHRGCWPKNIIPYTIKPGFSK
jgi:hypothetical protein